MPFDGIVTRAVTEELKKQLIPGKITRIHQPTDTELTLTIRSQGTNHTLLFSIHPTYARFHVTNDKYINPETPSMFCMVLRKYLAGAIIDSIDQLGLERIITFSIQTRNEIGDIANHKLVLELMGKHSNIMLIDEEKNHILDSMKHISLAKNRHRTILPGAQYLLPPTQNKANPLLIHGEELIRKLDFNAGMLDKQIVQTLEGFSPTIAKEIIARSELGKPETYAEKFSEIQSLLLQHHYEPTIYKNKREDFHVIPLTAFHGEKVTFDTANEMLDQFFSGKAERDRVKQQAKDLFKFIRNEKEKNERKLKKHRQTLKKAENANQYQKMGELLTANMHLVSIGDTEVTVIDYYDPDQIEFTIQLQTNKTPSENAQSFFKKYQKLKTSRQVIEIEIEKTISEINYLDQLLQQIDVASEEDIEEIREELREEGYLKHKSKQKKKANNQRKPKLETYESSDGTLILVGKNNKQNEYLTTKLAFRDEIWLHTKDIPGSHVVIRSKDPSETTIIEAAKLAAYFSKSRSSSSVPVDYTKVRHVKKPNGAKPGYVTYEQQKTVFVTPETSILALKK
ncbi:Rqc2 family fibronectin-binding protein [Virgibacillus sp. MG-45]|uniref:Rqc2 family fibronectin-binding protein n=1 Tax=Virgibacillus sp. MG-45 TaxID=3102791 RepID=UPI002EDB6E7D